MYSTKLDENRYHATCLAVLDKVSMLELCIDTGAKYTCCSYNDINNDLQEQDFENCDFKYFGGFVEGVFMKFYKYPVNQFTIGNIDIKQQNIWITFDNRVNDAVLGMDILKQITFLSMGNLGNLIFFKEIKELQEYVACIK